MKASYIELLIVLTAIGVQVWYFLATKVRIAALRDLLPANALGKKNIAENTGQPQEVKGPIIIETVNHSNGFVSVIKNINQYLRNNNNAADFGIIKGILDGHLTMCEEEINAVVNLPLYIGLLGTFLGVASGLGAIVVGGSINDATIDTFISGVMIAMISSFSGLLLTIINNAHSLRQARSAAEIRKNEFLNFLRIYILPNSGNGLAEVVDDFRNNINRFNNNFGQNLQLFDERLSGNIQLLGSAVTAMGQNIPPIVQNSQTNLQILEQLRSVEFSKLIGHQIKFMSAINDVVPRLVEFSRQQDALSRSIETMSTAVSSIGTLMDRVKQFEDGLNALGSRVERADYLGSGVVDALKQKMDILDQAYDTMRQHAQTTSGQIEHHLTQEQQKIESLSARILNEMQQAMNFNVPKNPWYKLEKLDMLERLEGINSTLNNLLQTTDSFKREYTSTEHFPSPSSRKTAPQKKRSGFFSIFKRRRYAGEE